MNERKQTKLYDLPDSEFQTGGHIDSIARESGYASGRSMVSEHNLWSATVAEVEQWLKEQAIVEQE